MTDWYYHLPGQGRVGPMAADDVREAYRDGRVQRDTLAWHVGARDWQPLDRFSDSLGLDEVAPPPVVSPSAFATPARESRPGSVARPRTGAAGEALR